MARLEDPLIVGPNGEKYGKLILAGYSHQEAAEVFGMTMNELRDLLRRENEELAAIADDDERRSAEYLPDLATIEAKRLEIQRGWNKATRQLRLGTTAKVVELLQLRYTAKRNHNSYLNG